VEMEGGLLALLFEVRGVRAGNSCTRNIAWMTRILIGRQPVDDSSLPSLQPGRAWVDTRYYIQDTADTPPRALSAHLIEEACVFKLSVWLNFAQLCSTSRHFTLHLIFSSRIVNTGHGCECFLYLNRE
jgi:hypothetical protein